jgi:tetratricopeptide (TPR) repeat protein
MLPTMRTGVLFLIGFLALAPAASAKHAELERRGLEAEARLDYGGAMDAYSEALRAALSEAGGGDAGAGAAAEVYVFKLAFLTERTGRFADLAKLLAEARKGGLPALLDARCAWYQSRAVLAGGDLAAAEKLLEPLGFVQRFAVAGPFDNERGGGFSTAYDPEKGPVDLSAHYAGKGREVGWTFPARDAFLGRVDLDAMLRPNDEALAYALTYVKWEGEPRAVALRVGSDEGAKVWWNEALVLSRDVNRALELDQDSVGVTLQPGWNKLLLKITERKGSWGFMVRITEPDGKPLGKDLACEPKAAVGVGGNGEATAKTPAPKDVRVATGAIEHFLALAKDGKAGPREQFQLGYLHYRRKAHDENEHPDRDAFKAAAEGEKDPALASIYHVYHSFVAAAAGEFSVNREENPRRFALERALELDPKNARATLLLADYYLRSMRNAEKAGELVKKALEIAPASAEARLLEADVASAKGWEARSRAMVAKLASNEEAKRTPWGLSRIAAARIDADDLAKGEEALLAALKIDFAEDAARARLIAVRKQRGNLEGALAAIEDVCRLSPFDVGARISKAALLTAQDRLEPALAALEDALKICAQDDKALAERGKLFLRMGKRDAALADFGAALTLNPNLVDLRRYVELLAAEEKPFEAEFRLDPMDAIAAAKDLPIDPEVSARILLDNTVARVNPDGTSSRFEQSVVRIENDDGVEAYDHHSVYYAVGEQKATIKRATVVKKDGRTEEARIDNMSSGEPSGQEFATYGARSVDLPTLEVGDIVILEHRIDDLRQSFFGDYFGDTHYFQGLEPIERSRYTLVAPAKRPLHFNPRKLDIEPQKRVSDDGATVTWSWEKRKVPRIEREPNMPPVQELAACVQVSTFQDWNAFAKWYWNLVHKQFEVSPEMRAKIAELTAKASTREEKIRAIYNFVVTDVRYNDKWEFGVHGFKPYNASSIFDRRFGDCKDKATLIITMLSAVDIPAFPVLIDAQTERGEEDYTLPLMDHFNHCIAYAPGPGPDGKEGWFLDGTAQHHEAHNLPTMDYGATVLIVRPERGELKTVKWPDPLKENGLKEAHRVEIKPDGGAAIETTLEPNGYYSVILREHLQNPGKRREQLEQLYGAHFAGATVTDESFTDLRNLDEPVKVRFKMEVPKFVKQAAGGLALEEVPSVLFERLYTEKMGDLATKSERKHDVVLSVPSGVEETIEYTLPEDQTLNHTPPGTEIDGEFGTYVKRYELNGRTLKVTRRLSVKAQRIPVSKYEEWRAFTNKIDRAEEERATMNKGGAVQ